MAGLRRLLPMLHQRCRHPPRTVRGQSYWLSFLCKTLSFSIPSRFIPALSLTPFRQTLTHPPSVRHVSRRVGIPLGQVRSWLASWSGFRGGAVVAGLAINHLPRAVFGFHSLANFCASAIWSDVVLTFVPFRGMHWSILTLPILSTGGGHTNHLRNGRKPILEDFNIRRHVEN
jgi:hypothetical protein